MSVFIYQQINADMNNRAKMGNKFFGNGAVFRNFKKTLIN